MRRPLDETDCRRGVAPWARFVLGTSCLTGVVLLLMQGYTPPGVAGEVLRNGIREGIDATPLFYTESDASYESELAVRNAMRLLKDRTDCATSPTVTCLRLTDKAEGWSIHQVPHWTPLR